MRLSFFCAHCKLHTNAADHTKCKKILRRQRVSEERSEERRLAVGSAQQAEYAGGVAPLAKYLQTVGSADSIDRDELHPGDTPYGSNAETD